MSRPGSRTIDILLVEDNPGDVRLTIEGLAEGNIPNRLHVARDGVEALEFLRRDGSFADAVRPDLILLDLNLPRMGGREVLARLKADPDLKAIPTIVLYHVARRAGRVAELRVAGQLLHRQAG